ncbi:MAG: PIN domain-containing protein [Gammaproteobacteria bacterium]
MRLFLDANILFSAAYRKGSPAELLFRLARAGYCELVTSAFALEEARRNIQLKRPERHAALEKLAVQIALSPLPNATTNADASRHGLPAKDVPILAAAITAGAEALVTGDRSHFGPLYDRRIKGLRVLTLAAALERVVS